MVRLSECLPQASRHIRAQDRFVDLYPVALRGKTFQKTDVNFRKLRQTVPAGRLRPALGEREVGDGTEQDGFGTKSKLPHADDIVLQPFNGGLEGLASGELRDDVVVIGVEPLRHFHGRDVAVAVAPCHGEIRIESRTGVLETVRDGSQCDGQIEYMIVEGEITYSDEGEPRIMLELPMPFFQLVRGFVELVFGKLPFPVPFKGFFEFAVSPDTGKT